MNSLQISPLRFWRNFPLSVLTGCLLAAPGLSEAGAETLTQALDNPALNWTAGGDVEWKAVERPGAHAGSSVAELWIPTGPDSPVYGPALESSLSWLETTATGPGTFAVWLRHNFNPYVELSLSVDGLTAEQVSIYGWPEEVEKFSGWFRFTAFLPSGSHQIRLTHRFSNNLGTIPIDNPRVQADDARVLPGLTADFSSALEIPAGETWFTGGGGEFRIQGAADSHDGTDSLISDAWPEGWDNAVAGVPGPPWLRREVSGPRTLRWWQRRLSRYPWQFDEDWTLRQLFIPAGNRTVSWSAWRLALDEFSEEAGGEVSLEEALDSGGMVFIPSGGTWKGARTSAAPDGADAAWTLMPANGASHLETVIDGPARLHFEYNSQTISAVDAGADGESLTCRLDGTPLYLPTGNTVTTPIPAGRHVIRWTLANTTGTEKPALTLLDQIKVTAEATVSLSEALDAPVLPWTAGGSSPASAWTGMGSPTAPDGQDAAVPPTLSIGETAWLETTVTGPGRLTFQWAGAEPPMYEWGDYQRGLSLSLDGQFLTLQNGNQPQPLLEIGPGPHTIRWTATGLAERRPLMLDQVRWFPSSEAAIPPFLKAAETPLVQFFTTHAALTTVDAVNHHTGETSLRVTSPGPWDITGTTLTAVAPRPGYLTYYSKYVPAGLQGGGEAGGEWGWQLQFLEPGALTTSWNVNSDPTEGAPPPFLLLDTMVFQPIPEIMLDQALRTPGPWRTSPGNSWTGLSEKGAWSGAGTAAAPSWLERDITGPAVVNFAWTGNTMSLSIDGREATPLTNYGQGLNRWLWLPAGPHVVRWISTSNRSSIPQMYIGGMTGDPSLSVSGPDFLMRVPRPAELTDNLISLEANSGGLDTYWGSQPAEVESSTPEALTLRFPRPGPEIPRRYYRVRFGPR